MTCKTTLPTSLRSIFIPQSRYITYIEYVGAHDRCHGAKERSTPQVGVDQGPGEGRYNHHLEGVGGTATRQERMRHALPFSVYRWLPKRSTRGGVVIIAPQDVHSR